MSHQINHSLGIERKAVIKIIPSEDWEMGNELRAMRLSKAIDNIFNSKLSVSTVEFLSFPSDDKQIYLLKAGLKGVPEIPESQKRGGQRTFVKESDTPDKGSRGNAASTALKKLKEALPSCDFDVVGVNFDPIGATPAATSRLLTEHNRHVAPVEHFRGHGFTDIIKDIDDPHLYQILISKKSPEKYDVAGRITLFSDDYQAHTTESLIDIIKHGRQDYPFEKLDDDMGLTSNLKEIPSYLTPYQVLNEVRVSSSKYDHSSERVRSLAKGHKEFHDLLAGREGYDPIYVNYGYHGRFEMTAKQLSELIGIPERKYNRNIWDDAKARAAPYCTEPKIRGSVSLEGFTGSGINNKSVNRKSNNPSAGGQLHNELEELTFIRLPQEGWEIKIVDQSSNDSVPDICGISPADEKPVAF
jgi:hypothetical protein